MATSESSKFPHLPKIRVDYGLYRNGHKGLRVQVNDVVLDHVTRFDIRDVDPGSEALILRVEFSPSFDISVDLTKESKELIDSES